MDDDEHIGETQMEVNIDDEDLMNASEEGDAENAPAPPAIEEPPASDDVPEVQRESKEKLSGEIARADEADALEITEALSDAPAGPARSSAAETAETKKPPSPQKINEDGGPALFGDEDEGEEDDEDEIADDEDRRDMAGSGETGDWMQRDQSEGVEEDEIVRILLEIPKGQPDASDKLMLVGLPTNVRLNMDIFEKDKCAEFESKVVKMGNAQELQELKKELLGNDSTDIIFCKSDEPVPDRKEDINLSSLHSTCKYVEFSDGTSAILIGQNAYTQIGSSDFSAVLLEVSQLPVMRVHGDINQRRIYSFASSTSNMRKSLMR